jgi:hypothetical protein
LRAPLPVGVDLADPSVLAEHAEETVALLGAKLTDVPVPRLAEAVGADLQRRTRPEPVGPLAHLAAAADLHADTPVRLRAGSRIRVDHSGDQLRLVLVDRSITIPVAASEAVRVALAGAPFTPAELPALDPDEQLVLVRRLLREGVLVAE